MKKIFSSILCASLLLASGVAALAGGLITKSSKKPLEADAAVSLAFSTGDSTSETEKFHTQEGSDPDYVYPASMSTTNNGLFYERLSGGSYFATQSEGTKKNDNALFYFFIYSMVPAYTQVTVNTTFELDVFKSASAGSAPVYGELFFLGVGDGNPKLSIPALNSNRFYTKFVEDNFRTTNYNNAATSNNSIGVALTYNNDHLTATKQVVFTLVNHTNTTQACRYQLALFVGCGYGSNYGHQAEAKVSHLNDSFTETDVVATIGSTAYTNLNTAITSASAGNTVNVVRDCQYYTSNFSTTDTVLVNLTLNLNNHTVTCDGNNSGFTIPNGVTLTINGGGGSIVKTHQSESNIALGIVYLHGTLNLNNVTINCVKAGCAAITVLQNGHLNVNSDARITVNSAHIDGVALLVNGTNSSAFVNGATLTAIGQNCIKLKQGTLRIYNATVTSNSYGVDATETVETSTLYIYGSSTVSTVNLYSGLKCTVYARYNSTNLTKALNVYVVGGIPTENAVIVNNDYSNKVSIISNAQTGYEYAREGNNIVYRRQRYAVTLNLTGCSKSSGESEMIFNSQYIAYFAVNSDAYELPDSISVVATSGGASIEHSWYKSTGRLAIGSTYAKQNVTITIICVKSTIQKVRDFINDYLYMSTYDPSLTGNGDNSCETYYFTARSQFNSLDEDTRTLFFTSDETSVVNARARLAAWAAHNHDSIDYDEHLIAINSSNRVVSGTNEKNSNLFIAVICVTVITSGSCLGLIIFKKRKHI